MRYAIIADIHSNLEALQAVLADIASRRVDATYCLGDVVGYHAQPNECVSLIRQVGIPCVAGNHDLAAAGISRPLHFGYVARAAVQWTGRVLTDPNRRFLAGLPLSRRIDDDVVLVHGALHPAPNANVRLSTPERLARSLRRLAAERARIAFYGHTHRRALAMLEDDAARLFVPGEGAVLVGGSFLVNPGSVGQPRDGTLLASYAVYDAQAASCSWHSVSYDVDACRTKAAAAGLTKRPSLLRRWWFWASDRLDRAHADTR